METKAANWSDQLTPEQAAEKVKSLATGKPISPTVGQHVGDFLHTTGSPLHWPSIREATIGGGVAGIGIGAILALVHQMRLQRKLKEIKTPPDVDEDTLTLNLPPGAATKLAEILTSPISVSTTSPMKSNKKVPVGSYRQPSYHNKGKGPTTMKISMDKSSGASWQTVLMELLGGTAAGIGGYKLTDMLYKNYVDRQLKKQEDSARQEMMTQLMAPKTGTWLDDAVQLPMCKDSQSAREPTGVIPAGLAGTIFLTLLATGGTAYLTKKLLDAKFHEATDQYKEALRVNPNYAEAHNNLGFIFMNQGKYQEATDQYKEALRINTNQQKSSSIFKCPQHS